MPAVVERNSLRPEGETMSAYPQERPPRERPAPPGGTYAIEPDRPLQRVWGLGFEIQSDSIASGNSGLPDETTSVPHDLTEAEFERFCDEMLSGFRYCRLAGGLYWRGTDECGKVLRPRWDGQLEELREMLDRAGVAGVSLEYWSPPPYWKANRRYVGNPWDTEKDPENVLRCFGKDFADDPDYRGDVEAFLADYARACLEDVKTLQDAGINVAMWGLANEPQANTAYSSCRQTPGQWARTYAAVAPAIREHDRDILLIADSAHDKLTYLSELVHTWPEHRDLVDAITVHTIGFDSASVMETVEHARSTVPLDRPIFQNEYEYLKGPTTPARCVNTVQNIMNWFQLAQAPTWFWIHALKPVGNEEAGGYSLGYWMPVNGRCGPDVTPELADLAPGHWTWNPYNWHALAGFLRHMPWDSTVLSCREDEFDHDTRILAYVRPDGKRVIVLSNRCGRKFRFDVGTNLPDSTFQGMRYTPDEAGPNFAGVDVGLQTGDLSATVPDLAWEFWIEQ
jgi:hypothetical protein